MLSSCCDRAEASAQYLLRPARPHSPAGGNPRAAHGDGYRHGQMTTARRRAVRPGPSSPGRKDEDKACPAQGFRLWGAPLKQRRVRT